MLFPHGHLAYCTNIHPAETWADTLRALQTHALAVRDLVSANPAPFALGLRLSARAADELLEGDALARFRDWLLETNTYVFTINGFPYGDFHGTRVKEQVYRPDWTDPARVAYTKKLFRILAAIGTHPASASVSTLPGSFKAFRADESLIRRNLLEMTNFLEALSAEQGRDFHLGLEPEPLGHFENTTETLAFFDRLLNEAKDPAAVCRRIGINYDACHFALEYDDARTSLDALTNAGLRISKVHLSAALALDPRDAAAVRAISKFDEPTYLHQVMALHGDGDIRRFTDLPDGMASLQAGDGAAAHEWRVHFHIPLDAEPMPPLRSTRAHAAEVLAWCGDHPQACEHFEIETYTWGVLPQGLQRPVEVQIAAEYQWVLDHA